MFKKLQKDNLNIVAKINDSEKQLFECLKNFLINYAINSQILFSFYDCKSLKKENCFLSHKNLTEF